MIVLPDAEDRTIVFFIRLDKTPERDRQTDLPWILQRSALRVCERCGRAVKISSFMEH